MIPPISKLFHAGLPKGHMHVNNKSYSIDTTIPYTFVGQGNYAYPDRSTFVLGSNSIAAVALNDEGQVDGEYLAITFTFAN
mgnify:CR=1 FL=1